MSWTITFFNERVKAETLDFPEGILSDFLHIAEIVILTSFVKKTQKTPKKEIDKARKRMKELQNG